MTERAMAMAEHDEELRRWTSGPIGQYYVVNTTTGRISCTCARLGEARELADAYAEAWGPHWEVVARHGSDGGPEMLYTTVPAATEKEG